MWPFKNGDAGTLTENEQAQLKSILAEHRKAIDPFAGLSAVAEPQATVKEEAGKTDITVPKIQYINVAPVEPTKKERIKKLLLPLAALLIIGFVGVVVLAETLGLLTLIAADATGAMIMYILGFYGFMAVAVLLVIIMVAYRIKLGPVWNYVKCINKPGKALMLLLRKTGVSSMEESRYVAETFEKDAKPARHEDPLAFFKTDNTPNILGRAGFGVFYDAANVMANPEFVLACQELKRQGYTHIEDAKMAWEAGNVKINIPLFAEVDFGALYDFIKGRPAISKAYCDTKVNEARAERDSKFWDNPQIMALGFIIICACIGIGILKALNVI